MTKEDILQIQVISYLKLQYPKGFYFHAPNGGKRNKIEASKFKRMGVLSGLSDVICLDQTFNYSGLVIELKIKPNKPTENQISVMNRLEKLGFKVCVCYDFESCKKIIDEYYKMVSFN